MWTPQLLSQVWIFYESLPYKGEVDIIYIKNIPNRKTETLMLDNPYYSSKYLYWLKTR